MAKFRPELQNLEARDVPSATIGAQGTLVVTGTDQADTIRVYAPADQAGKIAVTETTAGVTTTKLFDKAAISNVVIKANNGADYVRNETAFRSLIFGGSGADTIWGGTNTDFIFGGEGNDRIYGNSGNDFLDGGLGDDELRGMDGIDTLLGRLGNDTLKGGAGNDRLVGGQGSDKLEGGTGYDWIIGTSTGDSIIGGVREDVIRPGANRDAIANTMRDYLLQEGEKLDVLKGNPKLFFARVSLALTRQI